MNSYFMKYLQTESLSDHLFKVKMTKLLLGKWFNRTIQTQLQQINNYGTIYVNHYNAEQINAQMTK